MHTGITTLRDYSSILFPAMESIGEANGLAQPLDPQALADVRKFLAEVVCLKTRDRQLHNFSIWLFYTIISVRQFSIIVNTSPQVKRHWKEDRDVDLDAVSGGSTDLEAAVAYVVNSWVEQFSDRSESGEFASAIERMIRLIAKYQATEMAVRNFQPEFKKCVHLHCFTVGVEVGGVGGWIAMRLDMCCTALKHHFPEAPDMREVDSAFRTEKDSPNFYSKYTDGAAQRGPRTRYFWNTEMWPPTIQEQVQLEGGYMYGKLSQSTAVCV